MDDHTRFVELYDKIAEGEDEVTLGEFDEFHRLFAKYGDHAPREWEKIEGDRSRPCPLTHENMPREILNRFEQAAKKNGVQPPLLIRHKPPCSYPDCVCFAASTGKPGRPNTTEGLADFAKARRPDVTWQEIATEWNRIHPDEKTTKEKARGAHNRKFSKKKRV